MQLQSEYANNLRFRKDSFWSFINRPEILFKKTVLTLDILHDEFHSRQEVAEAHCLS